MVGWFSSPKLDQGAAANIQFTHPWASSQEKIDFILKDHALGEQSQDVIEKVKKHIKIAAVIFITNMITNHSFVSIT